MQKSHQKYYCEKIISPSDIGFHNILYKDNKLFFIDFEYAGWDDCFKMIADLVLQPEGCLDSEFFQISKSLFSFSHLFIFHHSFLVYQLIY